MKTAIQEVFDYLERIGVVLYKDTQNKFSDLYKQQIIEAHNAGQDIVAEEAHFTDAEQYYKETYETLSRSRKIDT